MLDGSLILVTSAIHLITIVPACLLGESDVKLSHPSIPRGPQASQGPQAPQGAPSTPGGPKHPREPQAPQGVPSTPGGRHGMGTLGKVPEASAHGHCTTAAPSCIQ